MTGFPLEQVTNGAELRLGAGTFQVTAPLVIDKDTVLTGAGQNSTTITMGGTLRDLIISVTEAEVTITEHHYRRRRRVSLLRRLVAG